jgi:hypothetical protein
MMATTSAERMRIIAPAAAGAMSIEGSCLISKRRRQAACTVPE